MKDDHWDIIISSSKNPLRLDIKGIWRYRDLIILFIRRDLVAVYKQTVLGPLWHIVQPLLTTITFTFIFGRIAGLDTDGVPQILFYMSGIILWSYFSESLRKTSNTFISNQHIFDKVYFPRLIMPISIVLSSMISLGIQLTFFFLFLGYHVIFLDYESEINSAAFLFPILIFIMALLGLSFGIIVSSLTTKYRDFTYLVGFGVQLLMYLSAVIYPISSVPAGFRSVILLNPMTPVIETFRFGFLGHGFFSWFYITYSFVFAVILFIISIILFNRIEKNFTDTL